MSRKSGYRFPACAKPSAQLAVWLGASAGEARSEKDMRNQRDDLMRTSLVAALLALSVAATVFSLGAGAQAPAPFRPSDEQPEDLPTGPGRDETFYACTACHNFKLVSAQGMS